MSGSCVAMSRVPFVSSFDQDSYDIRGSSGDVASSPSLPSMDATPLSPLHPPWIRFNRML
ncbi:hypothetical protein I3842_11G205900 [Carya illinoinensis]|uniref:Uncharacterized protein n=1 Tax=Carya illinoinensis TaxID=32201 RepID=A0A922DSV3_CARIL|nr:hypothetical protein I3842_11G205900 [Carya illinoinensis]